MQVNRPAEWGHEFTAGISGLHPTYPTDGRETIFEPYEALAPTDTVGRYLSAADRVARGDDDLPEDFGAYLAQRVPSDRHFGTSSIPFETKIDRFGRLVD